MNYSEPSIDKKLAMADVDDTITLMNTAFAFIDYLFNQNTETEIRFDTEIYKEKEKLEERHRKHELTRDEVVTHFTRIYREGIRCTEDRERKIAKIFVKEKVSFFDYVKPTVEELKNEGYYFMLLSVTPDTVIQEIKKVVGANEAIGTKREGEILTSDGKYHIIGKRVKELKLNDGYSIGIGDSDGDLGIFYRAHIRILVNPTDKHIEQIRRENNWPYIEKNFENIIPAIHSEIDRLNGLSKKSNPT